MFRYFSLSGNFFCGSRKKKATKIEKLEPANIKAPSKGIRILLKPHIYTTEKPRINKQIHWFYVDIGPIRVENIREFQQRRRRRQQERQNSDRFSKTSSLHVHHAFLYISLPLVHDYDVKMPIFTFYGGRKQATGKFLSLFKLECVPQEINSREICLHKKFSMNWNKRDKV